MSWFVTFSMIYNSLCSSQDFGKRLKIPTCIRSTCSIPKWSIWHMHQFHVCMELTLQWEQRLWVVSLSRCWLLAMEGKKINTVTMLLIYYVEVCINIKAAYQRSNINGQVVYNTWSGEFVCTEAVHRRPTSTGWKVYMMMCMHTP